MSIDLQVFRSASPYRVATKPEFQLSKLGVKAKAGPQLEGVPSCWYYQLQAPQLWQAKLHGLESKACCVHLTTATACVQLTGLELWQPVMWQIRFFWHCSKLSRIYTAGTRPLHTLACQSQLAQKGPPQSTSVNWLHTRHHSLDVRNMQAVMQATSFWHGLTTYSAHMVMHTCTHIPPTWQATEGQWQRRATDLPRAGQARPRLSNGESVDTTHRDRLCPSGVHMCLLPCSASSDCFGTAAEAAGRRGQHYHATRQLAA